MFNQTMIIEKSASPLFGAIRKGKAVLAAAVAAVGLGIASHAYASPATVTAITATMTDGTPNTVDNIIGVGTTSGYTSSHSYDITYDNDDLQLNTLTAGGVTYTAGPIANNVVLNRLSGGNFTDLVFDQGDVAPTATNLTLMGPLVSGAQAALSGNNLLIGADNVLNDAGNPNGNNTNIQRVDVVFNSGITASLANVFAIFDRGATDAHDGFKIAAITGMSGGVPTSYGPLISLSTGSWGTTDVEPSSTYAVTRKNDAAGNVNFHPSDAAVQPIGGVVIHSTDLATAGTTIFGYSLFADNVTASGAALAQISNLPTDTTETNGGLDLVGTEAVLFTSTSVPEPTTAVAAVLGVAGLLGRRSKRRRA
jgi:MYXO-CTERM domain-containing protein